MSMVYTKTLPTKVGWYWIKVDGQEWIERVIAQRYGTETIDFMISVQPGDGFDLIDVRELDNPEFCWIPKPDSGKCRACESPIEWRGLPEQRPGLCEDCRANAATLLSDGWYNKE